MKIAVTGATGLVGSSLVSAFESSGHSVHRVVRGTTGTANDIEWDIPSNTIDSERFNGLDAVVHLAGENIATGRWSAAKKNRIRDSRVHGTSLLCQALAELTEPPQVLVAASAIGFYGDREDDACDEASDPGKGFLAEVCTAWEQATEPAKSAGIRVVNLRIGIVLSPKGGALKQMLLPFKLGAGGRVGSGQQYWSWISLPDLVNVIVHCIDTQSLSGPVNAVSPVAVTNLEFTKALGRVLRRPTILPMPAFGARLALGQMADELLLASTKVVPKRLRESRYDFRHDSLESTLHELL